MYGLGIIRGLGVTLKHFIDSYLDDFRFLGKRYYDSDAIKIRQGTKGRGAFTVQYPEEKLPVPENFRFVPFLVYDVKQDGTTQDRCTSCGICSKVCPPQCIWIERTTDPVTKRPIPEPKEFSIDIDICMNCGFCAEFCPFDAIKMDHDYELASYDRTTAHIHNKERLSKPASYYQSIRPTDFLREELVRAEEEAKKAAKTKAPAPQPAVAVAQSAPAVAPVAPVVEAAPAEPLDPEAEARKREMAEKRKAMLAAKKAAKGG